MDTAPNIRYRTLIHFAENMAPSPNMQERELVDRLIDALNEIPRTTAHIDSFEVRAGDRYIDALLKADVAGRNVRILVEAKKQLYPRDVRQVVWMLQDGLRWYGNRVSDFVLLVAAETISPGARNVLREEGVGYFDGGGSLYLPAEGAFIMIERPQTRKAGRKAGVLFRGSRAQVLHAVWDQRHNWFSVHHIAQLARVAPATASETLTALEREGWVISQGSGPSKERRLENAGGLLDAWADYQRATRPKLKRYWSPAGQGRELARKIDQACGHHGLEYEITGELAAQSYAPYLTSVSQVWCRMPAGRGAEFVLRDLEARPVEKGWNLGVIEAAAERELAFRTRGDEAWLASPLQTWLDLLQGPARAGDMAGHLRAELLS